MPFFFDVTREGETRPAPSGPFDSSAEAGDAKTLYDTERPDDTTGDVYEAAADHPDTFPACVMLMSRDGVDFKVYDDGTEEQA
jgi:hypothetical protein